MLISIYDSHVLRGVVASLIEPVPFFLGRFFGLIQESNAKKIHFDVEEKKRRITPFVHPLVAGRVVERLGYATKTFEPAYAKDKRQLDPNRPLRRRAGERIGGELSPMDRRRLNLATEIEDQLAMLTMREEVMAAEALRTGKVTVAGDGYDQVQVDYGRDAALTVTLLGADRWSDAASNPVDDIEDWAALIQTKSGAVPTDVVLEPTAWKNARQHAEIQRLLETRRGSASAAETGPLDGRIGRFVGTIGDFRLWVYQQQYVDNDGATQSLMPTGQVILTGPDLEGVRHYGTIEDEAAGYAATRFHVKSWLEEDPAVRWLLLQSAPLVVPYRPNASLSAIVL